MKTQKLPILIATTLCSFITPIAISSVNIAMPAIINEFKLDNITAGWIITAYLLVTAMLLAPFGKLGDMRGRIKIFKAGILIYTLSSFLAAFSLSEIYLIIFRIFQGLGAAMMWSVAVAILIDAYDGKEKGKVLGINIGSVYLGLSLGPFIGGILTHNFGWRYIFIFIGIIGLTLSYISFMYIKNIEEKISGGKVDSIGILLYCGGLTALFLGVSIFPEFSGVILVFTGAFILFLFGWWEYKIDEPMLNIKLFAHNRIFVFSNIAALINYSSTFAVAFLLSLYLQYIKGLDAQKAGIILIAQPVMQFIISPFAGRLSDRIKPAFLASAGMFLTAAGLVLLILINNTTSIFFIVVALIMLGTGFGFFSAPNTNAVMSSVKSQYYGIASGILGTMRMLGQMMSMAIVIILFALIMGKTKIDSQNLPVFLSSVKYAFAIFSGLCFLGVFASLARGK